MGTLFFERRDAVPVRQFIAEIELLLANGAEVAGRKILKRLEFRKFILRKFTPEHFFKEDFLAFIIEVIELKFEGSAEDALAQIDEKQYSLPFAVDNRKIVKIGANVSKETRNIEKWIVEG